MGSRRADVEALQLFRAPPPRRPLPDPRFEPLNIKLKNFTWLWGPAGTGKTEWAVQQCHRPIVVTNVEQLAGLKFYQSRRGDGPQSIVFDNCDWTTIPPRFIKGNILFSGATDGCGHMPQMIFTQRESMVTYPWGRFDRRPDYGSGPVVPVTLHIDELTRVKK